MQVIQLAFKENVDPERQNRIMDEILLWPGVEKFSRLNPDIHIPEIYNMCNLYLRDEVDPKLILNKLRLIPELKTVDIPPERRLIW